MSMIGNKANQMSLRTGVPICNHGMVPVYHPRGGGSQSIFTGRYQAPMRAPHQPQMSGLMRAGFITNLVFGCIDSAMGWIGQIMSWFGGNTPATEAPVADKPAADQPVADKPVADQPVADQPVEDEPKADEPDDDEGARDQYNYGVDTKTTEKTEMKFMRGCGPYQYAQLFVHEDGSELTHAERMDLVQKFRPGGTNSIQEEGTQRFLDNKITLSTGKTVILRSNWQEVRVQLERDPDANGINQKYTERTTSTQDTWWIKKQGSTEKETFDSEAAFNQRKQELEEAGSEFIQSE